MPDPKILFSLNRRRRADFFYRRFLVTLVDILGFSNMLRTQDAREVARILAVKERFARLDPRVMAAAAYKTRLPKLPMKERSYVHNFSDLVVSSNVLTETFTPEELILRISGVFFDIGYRQASAAIAGIFVRGGAAYGDLFVRENTIFGPALLRAYELESREASFPIIAIDNAVVDLLLSSVKPYRTQMAARSPECEISSGFVLFKAFKSICRTAEFSFIDYIACCKYHWFDDDPHRVYELLQQHKKAVEIALEGEYRDKYVLIAKYHNYHCSSSYPSDHSIRIESIEDLKLEPLSTK